MEISAARRGVLVVDHDDAQLAALCEVINNEGFRAIAASSTTEALHSIEAQEVSVAVVEDDPAGDASTSLLAQIRARDSTVRVILRTSAGSYASAKAAIKGGAFGYVDSPADLDELLRTIHQAVDESPREMLESSARPSGPSIESQGTDERLRQLWMARENALSGIAIIDERGRFAATSEMYTGLLGYDPGELTGVPWQVTVHPDDLELATRAYEQMLEEGRSVFEARGRRKDGSHFFKCITLVRADAQSGFRGHYCMMHDITDRHEAMQARDALEAQLRRSQKMEALGRLAGGVAHDFNNLLTVILGNSESLLESRTVPNDWRKPLEQIRTAGERAAAMTRQLLAFSRHQVRKLEVLQLNDAVQRTEGLLRRLLPESIQWSTHSDLRVGAVKVDASQLEQVIVNLVLNARDAMSEPGLLTIETTAVEVEADQAKSLDLPATGTYACISVRDTGSGITPAIRDRIFEPFFTTKASGEGTGLGLATVYGIVSQAGGAVAVESAIGQGSTFRVYLPQTAEEAVATETDRGSESLGGNETILICEDEEMVLDLAKGMLEKAGYSVLTAKDGVQGLEVAAAHPHPIDLLLTDVVMPRMNGKELARQLLASRPGTRVLFVSGYPDDVAFEKDDLEAGTEFMEKPYSASVLRRRIRRILDSRG